MKKELTILERILIPNIFKQEGNYIYMTIKADVNKKVSLSQEEFVEFGVKIVGDNRLTWNSEFSDKKFEIDFSELELNELKSACEELDKNMKLSDENKSLYEKFVLGK